MATQPRYWGSYQFAHGRTVPSLAVSTKALNIAHCGTTCHSQIGSARTVFFAAPRNHPKSRTPAWESTLTGNWYSIIYNIMNHKWSSTYHPWCLFSAIFLMPFLLACHRASWWGKSSDLSDLGLPPTGIWSSALMQEGLVALVGWRWIQLCCLISLILVHYHYSINNCH